MSPCDRNACLSVYSFRSLSVQCLFLEQTMVVLEKQIKLPCEFIARSELVEKRRSSGAVAAPGEGGREAGSVTGSR